MTLEEAIKHCEEIAESNKGIAENYKKVRPYEDGWDFWEKESKTSYAIADWLKALKDIRSTGSCNECKCKGICKYEPESGQMVRYNCPFYTDDIYSELEKRNKKEEKRKPLTYGDIYYEFCKKFPNTEVSDFRPAIPMYIPGLSNLTKGIPNAIVVWLKDGGKIIYIAESEEKQ